MKQAAFVIALMAGLAVGPALAHQCPAMMAAIDAALPAAELSEADRDRVMELRSEGEDLHNAGDHAASEAALGEAQEILGID
jgi:hypothetical protein